MLCLGPKKNLLSPRLELTVQVQCTDDQSQLGYHSAKNHFLVFQNTRLHTLAF